MHGLFFMEGEMTGGFVQAALHAGPHFIYTKKRLDFSSL